MATFGNLETDIEPLAGLMREHVETHELVTEAREAIEDAIGDEADVAKAAAVIERLRDLDAYLAVDLTIHIAKEEDVLFPALRGFSAEIDKVVDEMVEQHDEVRLRKEIIAQVLRALDHEHDDVRDARAELAAKLRDAGDAPGPEALAELHDAVKRLDWILQGHFGDEEDDLFPPALELLSSEQFASLAREANKLDRQL